MIYLVSEHDSSPVISVENLDFLDRLIIAAEDEVDVRLDKLDGRIPRPFNSKLFDFIIIMFLSNRDFLNLDVNIINMANVFIACRSNRTMTII